MTETKTVSDTMGKLEIPSNVLYGAQTQRAINNFPVSGQTLPRAFIKTLLLVKLIAAEINKNLGCLDAGIADAIVASCESLMADDDLMRHFPVDVFQTGSGTSSNMNANEVIANLATEKLGRDVSPNDHVNFGQSSNDTIPTTIYVSATLEVQKTLVPALEYLIKTIEEKAKEVSGVIKTGRTHLMDAMPVSLSQSLNSWSDQLRNAIQMLNSVLPALHVLAQGGTAVGTGVNTHHEFASKFADRLGEKTGIPFTAAANPFPLMSSPDAAVALSGHLKVVAIVIMKISNDLRWMNSGPLAGLGEISLEALQPGSSIMPGKVNPVIPESSMMVAAQVIGNDTAIAVGGQSGNFELNVMLPMIASNLLTNITLLSNTATLLADKAVRTFEVNNDRVAESLNRNPILVTALNPVIGYAKSAEIAKQAYRDGRPILEVALEQTDISREDLVELLDPEKLTKGGL